MADRSIRVVLSANVAGYQAAIERARKSTKDFTDSAAGYYKKNRADIDKIATGLGAIGLAAGAAGAAAVAKFANFDSAMSAVAATGDDARNSLDQLRVAALAAGESTSFSATESAAAIEELAKAGVSAKDILDGGLSGALDLAAAGGLDVASAAEIAARAMTQFGLKGGEVPHVADLLAAGAGKAAGDVDDLAAALDQAGLVANASGLSIEETTGGLAAFAAAGLQGSDAGTSLKTMLQRLVPQSKEAAKLMSELGINAYDANGEFVGLAEYAGRLQEGMKSLSSEQRNAAMSTLYGSDAVRAANVLYEQGADGISRWVSNVNDQGYAAETAATKLDNLKGDVEGLTGALETAFIKTGEGADGPLRKGVQGLTGLVSGYNDLPPAAQNATMGVVGLTAAVGGSAWTMNKAVGLYSDTSEALSNLSTRWAGASKGAIAMRGAAGVAGVSMLALADKAGDANEGLGVLTTLAGGAATGFAVGGPFGAAVGGAAGLIGGLAMATGDSSDKFRDGIQAASDYAGTLDTVSGAATKATRAMVFEDLGKAGVLDAAKTLGVQSRDLIDYVLGNSNAVKRVNQILSDSTFENTTAVAELRNALRVLSGDFDDSAAKAEKARRATQTWGEALKGVPKDVRTELKNANYDLTLNEVVDLAQRYDELDERDIRTIMQALDYATPDIKAVLRTLRNADGQSAEVVITTRQRTIKETFDRGTRGVQGGESLSDLLRLPRAQGGAIRGPGTGTSDSIPALLSNGEHVLTAQDVRRMGGHEAVYRMREQLAGGQPVPRFRDGGAVKYRGRSLEYWEDRRMSGLELNEKRREIRDLERDLRETEKTKSGRRKKLRGLDARIARQELAVAKRELAEALIANRLNRSKAGTINARINRRDAAEERAKERAEAEKRRREEAEAEKRSQREAGAQARESLFDSVKSTAGGGTIAGMFDSSNPWVNPINGRSMAAGAAEKVRAVKGYADALKRLSDAKAPQQVMQEIAGMGVYAGKQAADALLADPVSLRSISQSYAQIDQYAGLAGRYVAGSTAFATTQIQEIRITDWEKGIFEITTGQSRNAMDASLSFR